MQQWVFGFMNLKGCRKAPGCGSLLCLPPETCFKDVFLLADTSFSYIYNLIKEGLFLGLHLYIQALLHSLVTLFNFFLTRQFCLSLKTALVWVVCSHGSLKQYGDDLCCFSFLDVLLLHLPYYWSPVWVRRTSQGPLCPVIPQLQQFISPTVIWNPSPSSPALVPFLSPCSMPAQILVAIIIVSLLPILCTFLLSPFYSLGKNLMLITFTPFSLVACTCPVKYSWRKLMVADFPWLYKPGSTHESVELLGSRMVFPNPFNLLFSS